MTDEEMDKLVLKAVYRLMASLKIYIDLVSVSYEMGVIAAEEGIKLDKKKAIETIIKGMGL